MKSRSRVIFRSAGIILPLLFLCINLVLNVLTVEKDIDRIENSNLSEIKGASEVTYHLQNIQSNFREIFLETLEGRPEEVAIALEAVNESFLKVHEYIALWEAGIEVAIEHEAGEYGNNSDEDDEKDEHQEFLSLKEKLFHYMANIDQALSILDVDGYAKADEYFMAVLEPLANDVLALTRAFQADTEQEIIDELHEVRTAVKETTISSAFISIIVLLIALLPIYDNSNKNRPQTHNISSALSQSSTDQTSAVEFTTELEAVNDWNTTQYSADFLDWSYISAISPNDAVVGEIVKSLLDEGPELMEDIEEAIRTQNPTKLQQMSHKFKGSSLAAGASCLAEKARQLEVAGKENDLGQANDIFEELQSEYKKVEAFLGHDDFIREIRKRATESHVTSA